MGRNMVGFGVLFLTIHISETRRNDSDPMKVLWSSDVELGLRGQAAGEMASPNLFPKESKGMFIDDLEEISLDFHG